MISTLLIGQIDLLVLHLFFNLDMSITTHILSAHLPYCIIEI